MIVGYVDHLGYLRCVPCFVAGMPHPGTSQAVHHDAAPHNVEACEVCRRVVKDVKPEVRR